MKPLGRAFVNSSEVVKIGAEAGRAAVVPIKLSDRSSIILPPKYKGFLPMMIVRQRYNFGPLSGRVCEVPRLKSDRLCQPSPYCRPF